MNHYYRYLGSAIVNILIIYRLVFFHLVKGDNSECTSAGGECQIDNQEDCTGGYLTGLCVGETNVRCCIPSDCKFMANEGNCEFYDQFECLNNFVKPNSEAALLYAKNHCNRLNDIYYDLDKMGQEWNIGIRKCLMLLIYCYSNRPINANFNDLLLKFTKECNLQSSSQCNLQSSSQCNLQSSFPGICKIIKTNINQMAITKIYKYTEDIDSFISFWNIAIEQMVELILNCIGKYPILSEDSDSVCLCNNEKLIEEPAENWEKELEMLIDSLINEIKKPTVNLLEPDIAITDNCQSLAEDGSCTFFTECLEARFHCYNDGFALDKGHKFCIQLDDKHNLFNLHGGIWAIYAKACLTKEMLPIYNSHDALSCHYIRAVGNNVLRKCFPGNMVCSIVDSDRNTFAASEIFKIQNDLVNPQIRKYGIQLETLMTYSMRFCYGFKVIPYCFKQINGQEMKLKTEEKVMETKSNTIEEKVMGTKCSNNWIDEDSNCICNGGECKIIKSEEENCPGGNFTAGKCSGNKNRQCCIPVKNEVEDLCIDNTFLCMLEGFSPKGYVPGNIDCQPDTNSGVTIGSGVDLGSNQNDYLKYNFSDAIMKKIEPYFSKKGQKAQDKLNDNPLKFTILEAKSVSQLVEEWFAGKIKDIYDEEIEKQGDDKLLKFSQLTLAQRTVIVAVYYVTGIGNGLDKAPLFKGHILTQSWEEAIAELRTFYTEKSINPKTDCKKRFDRECKEAQYLENDDQSGRNTESC